MGIREPHAEGSHSRVATTLSRKIGSIAGITGLRAVGSTRDTYKMAINIGKDAQLVKYSN